MIVVSDSSPLNYLILIGHADLQTKLYGQVVIPPAVFGELQRDATPALVRQWIAQPASWLKVQNSSSRPNAARARLDTGAREAIFLAEELHADAILIEERYRRRLAEQRHLTVIGTLQILDTAADEGIIDFPGRRRNSTECPIGGGSAPRSSRCSCRCCGSGKAAEGRAG